MQEKLYHEKIWDVDELCDCEHIIELWQHVNQLITDWAIRLTVALPSFQGQSNSYLVQGTKYCGFGWFLQKSGFGF